MKEPKGFISLTRFGPVAAEIEEHLRRELARRFGLPVRCFGEELALVGWNPERQQYLGEALLAELHRAAPPDALRVLALTEVDLYAPEMEFIFGQAEVGGRTAIVSLHRLHPEASGEAPNRILFLRRALVECVHELGHTFGLVHCPFASCVMHFSEGLEETDRKGPGFCHEHARQLRAALAQV